MPFKLKLKKSRQYNVSSKNLFVIPVELLDNTTVECTLSSQSPGQECLSNVCQRLGLQQPQYFGLRFLSKKGTLWWVDLEQPLKKQLDKYAQESSCLYLRVMYFISDVNQLTDEVTRYHYFLQLKSDIIEGKLHCNEDQTVLFTSYSLQAEFGDHDPERHTSEYLTNFGLLPKYIACAKENQEAILEQVINTHRNLQGLSQQLAEIYYIMEAQHLEGYGQECFAGKDANGTSVFIGVSLAGIFIRFMNDQPALNFPWDQIVNLVHHKRCFGIECHNNAKVIQTFMEDSHLAKYMWKTCIQQHRFYTQNEDISKSSRTELSESKKGTNFSLYTPNSTHNVPQCKNEQTEAKSQMKESHESLDGLGVYHTDGSFSEQMSPYGKLLTEQLSPNLVQSTNEPHNFSTPPRTSSIPTLQTSYSHPLPLNALPLPLSAAQIHNASDPVLYQSHFLNHVESRNSIQEKRKCPVLPVYRRAPDYDTAIKLKYGIQSCNTSNTSDQSSSPLHQNEGIMQSHTDVPHIYANQHIIPLQSYAHYKNYQDLSRLDVSEISSKASEAGVARNYEHGSAPSLNSPVHTYSSPELASHGIVQKSSPEQIVANTHLMYQYKPPPPYPYKQRSSSSTPDLTRNTVNPFSINSSPSILRKYLGFIPKTDAQIQNDVPAYQIRAEQLLYGQNHNVIDHYSFHEGNPSSTPPCKFSDIPTSLEPCSIKTSNLVNTVSNQQPTVTSQNSIQNCLPVHTYQNYNPVTVSAVESTVRHISEPVFSAIMTAQSTEVTYNESEAKPVSPPKKFLSVSVPQSLSSSSISQDPVSQSHLLNVTSNISSNKNEHNMGPMLMAAMNGLCISRPYTTSPEGKRFPKDTRIQALESRLADGQVFLEFERIIKKKPMADFTTALLPENATRNRFKDVFPYEENRVRLTPTSENRTGYINASHLSATVGGTQRFYIAAQGPLPNTLYSFWQMIWEHHVSVIVMLTEVQEQGRDKCFPYWPQENSSKLQIGEFQIIRNCSMSSPTYITCSLSLCHITTHQLRSVWHVQYTDWPDHSCPQDVQGFISFMSEVDAVRRHATAQQPQGVHSTSPIVVHCSAGVGRSGAVILCDIMLHALDHNQAIDIPKVLTQLRLQRMLTVQTLVQYKFVYIVLIQYLKNSRLI